MLTITSENGRLFGQPTGQSKEELLPESETTFTPSGVSGLRITFVKDDKGLVTELILRQGGAERRAKRIK